MSPPTTKPPPAGIQLTTKTTTSNTAAAPPLNNPFTGATSGIKTRSESKTLGSGFAAGAGANPFAPTGSDIHKFLNDVYKPITPNLQLPSSNSPEDLVDNITHKPIQDVYLTGVHFKYMFDILSQPV